MKTTAKTAIASLALIFASFAPASAEQASDGGLPLGGGRAPGVRFGATFSRHEIDYVNSQLSKPGSEHGSPVDWKAALADLRQKMGLQVIRVGVYWSQVQPEASSDLARGFAETDELLVEADRLGFEVLLTVGMKAPGWPEFYIPSWTDPSHGEDEVSKDAALRRNALAFVRAAVSHYRSFHAVRFWQVENESMDRAGESGYGSRGDVRRWIGADFVQEEVSAVRALDGRPIVLNCWSDDQVLASAPWSDNDYAKRNALAIGDILGLDVYPSEGGSPDFGCRRVKDIPAAWLAKARRAGKDAWVCEAQAEHWGGYSPGASEVSRLIDIEVQQGFRTILLWGAGSLEQLTHSDDAQKRAQGEAIVNAVASYTGAAGTGAGAPGATPAAPLPPDVIAQHLRELEQWLASLEGNLEKTWWEEILETALRDLLAPIERLLGLEAGLPLDLPFLKRPGAAARAVASAAAAGAQPLDAPAPTRGLLGALADSEESR